MGIFESKADRERFYRTAELERIADALAKYPGIHTANMLRLVMLTGCRPGEAMKATWDQFDLKSGVWIKPSAHTKQRRRHRVPLAPAAIELLQKARGEVGEDCSYVFPGRKPRGAKDREPLQQYRDCWRFVVREANLGPDDDGNPARPYDLRHSFATAGIGQGLPLYIVGKLLGHTQARTTQRYAHVDDDPLRQAVNRIGEHIAPKPTPNNVEPIRGGRA